MASNLPWSRDRPDELRYRFRVLRVDHPELFDFLWSELGSRSDNHVIVAMLEAGRRALLGAQDASSTRDGAAHSTASKRGTRLSSASDQAERAPSSRRAVKRVADESQTPPRQLPAVVVAGEGPLVTGSGVSALSPEGSEVAVGSIEALSRAVGTGGAEPDDAGRAVGAADSVAQGEHVSQSGSAAPWGDELDGSLGRSATDLVNQFF